MVGEDLLGSILALEDPLGIISMYVGVGTNGEPGLHPSWALELRHALDESQAHSRAEWQVVSTNAVQRRLEELTDELEFLVSPRESGRGRALFAGLAGGEAIHVSLPSPFRTEVALAGFAVVRPLASVLEAGRAAGVALVSGHELRLCEWRPGAIEELRSISIPELISRHELLGPSAGHPRGATQAGPGFHASQQRDLHERRVADAQRRFVSEAVDLPRLAKERGWDAIVVGGEEWLTAALLEHLPQRGSPSIFVQPGLREGLPTAQLDEVVGSGLEQERLGRQMAELERIRDAALSGGRGAIGLADTLTALAEGRVDLMLLPAERTLRGSRAADGTLFPAGVSPPGVADLRPEGLLAERMIQRALETDADVLVLRDAAEAALGADEAAALLRW